MKWLIVLLGLAAGLIGGILLVIVEFGAVALVTPRRVSEPSPDASEDDERPTPGRSRPNRSHARASDGVELAGRWIAAPGPPKGRTMILVHGFVDGPERDDRRPRPRDPRPRLEHRGRRSARLRRRAGASSPASAGVRPTTSAPGSTFSPRATPRASRSLRSSGDARWAGRSRCARPSRTTGSAPWSSRRRWSI